MRTLLLMTVMVFSFSAFAQTRVVENIKQQSVINPDGSSTVVKAPRPEASGAPKVRKPKR